MGGGFIRLGQGQISVGSNMAYIGVSSPVKLYTGLDITAQTSDPGAGSALPTGRIVLVYE